MNHSGKLMWGCVVIAVAMVILAITLTDPFYLLFVLPCMVMIGAMLWMITGGTGGNSGGGG